MAAPSVTGWCHHESGMSHGDANREWLVAIVVVDSQVDPFDLDALAVSDRFRLFGFTRRDDYLAYLWVLRAIDRLRGAHVAQAHTDDVAEGPGRGAEEARQVQPWSLLGGPPVPATGMRTGQRRRRVRGRGRKASA